MPGDLNFFWSFSLLRVICFRRESVTPSRESSRSAVVFSPRKTIPPDWMVISTVSRSCSLVTTTVATASSSKNLASLAIFFSTRSLKESFTEVFLAVMLMVILLTSLL